MDIYEVWIKTLAATLGTNSERYCLHSDETFCRLDCPVDDVTEL